MIATLYQHYFLLLSDDSFREEVLTENTFKALESMNAEKGRFVVESEYNMMVANVASSPASFCVPTC
jgi:hypothetical protein